MSNQERAMQLLDTIDAGADEQLHAQLDELREAVQGILAEHSEFVSVMVHEVRKPMTSIRGYADMLAKNVVGELNEMQLQFATTIRNNIISMEQLVSDLSYYSKLQAGRVTPEPSMEMFKNIVMQLEKDFGEKAEENNVTLKFDVPQGLPLLNLDKTMLGHIFGKLLDNAIKYAPDSNVLVAAEGRDNMLRVTVRDNGIGIVETAKPRLGELFFRGDQELVTQTKGYGLGLPIVLACLALMGGELNFQSTLGEGSTFEVLLPAMS